MRWQMSFGLKKATNGSLKIRHPSWVRKCTARVNAYQSTSDYSAVARLAPLPLSAHDAANPRYNPQAKGFGAFTAGTD
ncbi:hypothetical protein NXC12_PD00314 (plasmid) [Rhizobium etli]|uniref:Uncharacterized protein n=1 Tax=Rhizobium etli TaxID=29449 RepID=A0AAN1EN12_RHIET|nr:hypothetical protein NXC12_PD00314 [Rhizobium etli]